MRAGRICLAAPGKGDERWCTIVKVNAANRLRSGIKPWLFVPLLAAATALILYGISAYRHRFVRSDADMVSMLPARDATVFFVDVAALRHAGFLQLVSGARPASDAEYQEFVRQTHFDYTKNLDAIAGSAANGQLFLVIRGRFDWRALRQFAQSHGGSCSGNTCRVPTSTARRWTEFLEIQPNAMALALSGDRTGIERLRARERHREAAVPRAPVWVSVAPGLLKDPATLPPAVRIFAISLESTDSVLLSLAPAKANSGAAFELRLDGKCRNDATAETARNQLQIETKMLQLEMLHEHQQPSPSDLTGLLTAGTFWEAKKHVYGEWPVRKELLRALE